MRVSRYRGEKNLTELATRLYRLDADGSPPPEAAAALAEANQHLSLGSRGLSKKVPQGTLIAVPELDGTYDGRSSVPRTAIAGQVVRLRAMDVLERVASESELRDATEAADIDALERTLNSDAFWELANSQEGIKEKANSIRRSIDERRQRLELARQRRARVLEDAKGRIDLLAGIGGHGNRQPADAGDAEPDGDAKAGAERKS